jgi:hypothetical protein
MRIHDLVPILQISIGPVILISGVGLLLLSMTNRFGRVIDRSRALAHRRQTGTPHEQEIAAGQLEVLTTRASLCRLAIALALVSVLLASLLVIALFLTALFGLESAALVIALFSCCLGSLIASLAVFLKDINLSLAALRLELASAETRSSR